MSYMIINANVEGRDTSSIVRVDYEVEDITLKSCEVSIHNTIDVSSKEEIELPEEAKRIICEETQRNIMDDPKPLLDFYKEQKKEFERSMNENSRGTIGN